MTRKAMLLKNLISLSLFLILYNTLVSFYLPHIIAVVSNNGSQLEPYPVSFFDLYTFFFCSLCLLAFILIGYTKKELKSYFSTMVLLVLFVTLTVIAQVNITDWLTGYTLDPSIVNKFSVTYRFLYFLPTLILFPLCFKQFIILINAVNVPLKYNLLSARISDIRAARFIAIWIDILIVYLLAFFFSKVVVLYPDTAMLVLIGFFYYFFTMEYSFATTPGKMLLGLRIVDKDQQNPSALRIFLRTLSRFIPLYPLSILFQKKGLHDLFSGTNVVRLNNRV